MKQQAEYTPQDLVEQLDNQECIICCERKASVGSNGCAHRFCYPCIKKWAYKKRNCPLCRAPISSLLYHRRVQKPKIRHVISYTGAMVSQRWFYQPTYNLMMSVTSLTPVTLRYHYLSPPQPIEQC